MKVRNGFVSNSSSSSFIVFFPHTPKNVEELKHMMFPRWDDNDTVGIYNDTMTVGDIVKRVLIDINHNIPVTKKQIFEEVYLSGVCRTSYDYECLEGKEDIKNARQEADASYKDIIKHEESMKLKYNMTYDDINSIDLFISNQELNHEENNQLKRDIKTFLRLRKKDRKMSKKYTDLQMEFGKKYISNFIEKNKLQKAVPFKFEYEDKTKEGCIMESSGIFNKIPHIKINKH